MFVGSAGRRWPGAQGCGGLFVCVKLAWLCCCICSPLGQGESIKQGAECAGNTFESCLVMALTLWLSALCLLAHALHCTTAEQGEQPADVKYEDHTQQKDVPLTNGLALFRSKRQLERRGPTHLSQSSLPGAVSVKGFPNALIQQADRSRRHLIQAANKKKSKRKSRVGSFSLLTHDKSTPLQVIRARRQTGNEPQRKGKGDRTGAFSVLGDPQSVGQTDRPQ